MATEIVIPDSGPLISLGRIDRLDLLDRFRCSILITDMVAEELLRGTPGAPDRHVFKKWFEARGNQVQAVETSIGLLWRSIPEDRKSVLKRIKDAGETSIWQFSNSLRETMDERDDAPLIFEDQKIKTMDFGPNVSKLTTWSFILGLERLKVIPSAEDIFNEIAHVNRCGKSATDQSEIQQRGAAHVNEGGAGHGRESADELRAPSAVFNKSALQTASVGHWIGVAAGVEQATEGGVLPNFVNPGRLRKAPRLQPPQLLQSGVHGHGLPEAHDLWRIAFHLPGTTARRSDRKVGNWRERTGTSRKGIGDTK